MKKVPKRFVPAVVGGGLLLFALVGFLAVVRPQQSKASSLAKEIESVRFQIKQNKLLARPKTTLVAVRVADVFRLSKAMPDEVDMPGILLELNRVAGQSGITFESIIPQGQVATSSYRMVPVQVVFSGNYYELSDLLFRLRNLVEVHDGELAAAGRLFTVDSLHFVEGEQFPKLEATMTVNAFVYGGGVTTGTEGTTQTPTTPAGSDTSTPTTTTTTPTTTPSETPSSAGPTASAAGVTQ